MTRREAQPSANGGIYVLAGAGAKSKKTSGLFRPEAVLLVVIVLQSLAIIAVYESASRPQLDVGNVGALSGNATTAAIEEERPNNSVDPSSLAFSVPNPGGLILSSCFSYMQDPREVHRKRPLPHILPTFENMYHFHTTVVHQKLNAIVFHDDASFNTTFVKRHASDFIKFVRVEAPTFDKGEPVISPNDFRYVVFNEWLKEHSETNEKGQAIVDGVNYDWILISDLDVFFQRNPFPKLDSYAKHLNLTFFGSYDGGKWEDETMRLQRRLFRKCYGRPMIMKWRQDVEWATPNGNCGLWAGRWSDVSCILSCMAHQYDAPPVQGKGDTTICDMAVHDYCVHYGGCFPGSTKGVYDQNKRGVLWGEQSQGRNDELFGPPYNRHRQCDRDTWTALHNRCDWKGPLCFRKNEAGALEKYHQSVKGRKCRLDPVTDLPLENPSERMHHSILATTESVISHSPRRPV